MMVQVSDILGRSYRVPFDSPSLPFDPLFDDASDIAFRPTDPNHDRPIQQHAELGDLVFLETTAEAAPEYGQQRKWWRLYVIEKFVP